MDGISDAMLAALAGLLGGVALGLAARRAGFCTLGAIEDALYAQDYRRARMWGLAIAVAILGVFALEQAGLLPLSGTLYARYGWSPLASIAGGLLFGYGMAMAGNCGFGALSRAGGGDLKSVVILLVMGVAAYAVLAGPLAPLRLTLFPAEPADPGAPIGYAHGLGAWLGLSPLWFALPVAVGAAVWALRDPAFRGDRNLLGWSLVVGAAVPLGWWATAHLATTGFDAVPVESFSFTGPLGETLLYAMTSSGGEVGFGVGAVLGVALGAALGSYSNGSFQWEACDDPRELGRQMVGGILMGVGGIIAMGCSIGQGLTAMSTLAWSAPVVALSIVAGAALGLRQLIEGVPPHRALALLLGRFRSG